MLYKTEIMVNKKVMASLTGEASHPNQAIRRVLDKAETSQSQPTYMNIYILNEQGEAWVYAVRKTGKGYSAMITHKSTRVLPKNIVHSIFSGNTNIAEVL